MGDSISQTSYDLHKLKELGRKGGLYTVEIIYTVHSWALSEQVGYDDRDLNRECTENTTRLYLARNLTVAEMRKMRMDVFQVGIAILVSRGHWKVVCPTDVVDVNIYQQSGYFDVDTCKYL